MSNISGARIGSLFDNEAISKAYKMYEEFRNRRYDFVYVSRNTGMSIEYTQMIKNYIFKDYHIQMDGTERFEPAYDIAQSWNRLSAKNGAKILEHDIILLHHELTEIRALLQNPDWMQLDAHRYANTIYNYQLASDKYYLSIGINIK